MRARFSSSRRDFSAPKKSSPRTVLFRKISWPSIRRLSRSISLSRIAMAMLVSRRYLPVTGIDPLAVLLDGCSHLLGGFLVQDAVERNQILDRRPSHPR